MCAEVCILTLTSTKWEKQVSQGTTRLLNKKALWGKNEVLNNCYALSVLPGKA